MQKKLVLNIFWLITINLLIKPLWIFGAERSVQLQVGFSNYGLYYALLNLSYLFSFIPDMGINSYSSRSLSRDHTFLSNFYSPVISLKLVLAGVYLLITLGWGISLGFSNSEFKLLLILCAYQIFSSLLSFLRSNIAALQLFRTDSILSVLDRVLVIIGLAFIFLNPAYRSDFAIEHFALMQAIACMISVIIAMIILKQRYSFPEIKWAPAAWGKLIRQVYPYALLYFGMMAYNKIDSLMLQKMLPDGDYENGLYAAAYRILDASVMIAVLTSSFLYPTLSRMLKQQEPVAELVKNSSQLLLTLCFILVAGSFFYRQDIMLGVYGKASNVHLAETFGLLMFSLIPMASNYIFSTLLTARGNMKLLNITAFAALVLNVALNLILIPEYKAWGSALATLITFIFTALIHYGYCYRLFNLPLSRAYTLRALIFISLTISLPFLLKPTEINWMWQLCIFALFALLFSAILGIFQANKFRALFI